MLGPVPGGNLPSDLLFASITRPSNHHSEAEDDDDDDDGLERHAYALARPLHRALAPCTECAHVLKTVPKDFESVYPAADRSHPVQGHDLFYHLEPTADAPEARADRPRLQQRRYHEDTLAL
jgi:hypothetical protein